MDIKNVSYDVSLIMYYFVIVSYLFLIFNIENNIIMYVLMVFWFLIKIIGLNF